MSDAPYVGGRVLLEAGDVVEIYERAGDGETVMKRRARVKHTTLANYDGRESIWQTPLGIFPDAPLVSRIQRDRVPMCPSCGDRGWVCSVCAYVLDDSNTARCAGFHPEYGFTCVLPVHNGPHFDMSGGHWDETGQLFGRADTSVDSGEARDG